MAEVDVDITRKRRLPLWMLGVAAADQVRKSGKQDENLILVEEKFEQKAPRPKSKSIVRRVEIKENSLEKEGSEVDAGFLITCEARKKTQKRGKKAVNSDDFIADEPKTNLEKRTKKRTDRDKKSIAEHSTLKKRSAKKHGFKRSESLEGSSLSEESEDEGELTMEDLISMAEEYVKADDDQKKAETLTRSEPKPPKTQPPCKSIFSSSEWRRPLEPVISGPEASMSSLVGPTAIVGSTVRGRREKENLVSQGEPVNAKSTEDPTQDMLDLFLGPLLKKPHIEEVVDSYGEDIALACRFSQGITSELVGGEEEEKEEEEAPLMKKKSSLKDKITMLLS